MITTKEDSRLESAMMMAAYGEEHHHVPAAAAAKSNRSIDDASPNEHAGEQSSSSSNSPSSSSSSSSCSSLSSCMLYESKKPKWWRSLSSSSGSSRRKKATKSQRQAMAAMEAYKLNIVTTMPPQNHQHGSISSGKQKREYYIDWNAVFPPSSTTTTRKRREIWLEIGCGTGDNLLALAHLKQRGGRAAHHNNIDDTDYYFVGAEIHKVALGRLFHRMHQATTKGETYWQGYNLYHHHHDLPSSQSSASHDDGDEDDHINDNEKTAAADKRPEPEFKAAVAATATATAASHAVHSNDKNDDDTTTAAAGSRPSTEMSSSSSNSSTSTSNMEQQQQEVVKEESDLYENVRIFTGDAVKLLQCIPTNSLSAILVTFPDPFFQTTEVQYRLHQSDVLREMHRTLNHNENGGKMYLATDHVGYHEWAHGMVASQQQQQQHDQHHHHEHDLSATENESNNNNSSCCWQEVKPIPNRHEWLPAVSRYEQKGWDEGRQTMLSCWRPVGQGGGSI
jgi:tRNA G46 methylase TrmB